MAGQIGRIYESHDGRTRLVSLEEGNDGVGQGFGGGVDIC